MNETHISKIAGEMSLKEWQVSAAAELFEADATVPFIARYRKEATGSLDEVALTVIRDRLIQLKELDKRRESILTSLEERELLTDELKGRIEAAATMTELEDIYLPFRPKRRTRATIAREKGLEPLAALLFDQLPDTDPLAEAAAFVDPEKSVESAEDALAGARDIIAEWVNEDQECRKRMRRLFEEESVVRSKVITGQEETGAKFRDYFEWEEPVRSVPSHRILAMRRGESEGVLSLRIRPSEEAALDLLGSLFVKNDSPAGRQVSAAVEDCYSRLLSLSMETEIRLSSKEQADAEAIRVFAENLRELLMAPPLGRKTVLAVDPGLRTGCKVACLDAQGKLLNTDTFYLTAGRPAKEQAAQKLKELCESYSPEAIAVGNGTGGRDAEGFIRGQGLCQKATVVMVNESGASVYSASEAARKEFPDLDLTFRGAVSIGRRLMDPLAELVKIDPKSIGVGQYQHDVNQNALKQGLDDVVISCVNRVGVEVNTASEELLTYVSGLGPGLAKNIVAFRNENGPFSSRKQFLKVTRLGPKAFEQCAGFLRIRDGENPLDASAVHPESYDLVEAMAKDLACTIEDLLARAELRKKIALEKYVTEQAGLPTLTDIVSELEKPGRDPRKQFEAFSFTEGVETMNDLESGMKLPGIVTNVTAFGAFVDIGVHQDGLVHLSQMADHFVKDPSDIVKVHQRVNVTVLDVDLARKRIGLSMRETQGPKNRSEKRTETKGRKPNRKQDGRKPQKKSPAPFNNPFVDAFKK